MKEMKILGVASMFYQGNNHTHPVRRTVLVLHEDARTITGMEIREGRKVRSYAQARQHVRIYKKSEIAKFGDYSRLKASQKNAQRRNDESTLERMDFLTLIRQGI